MALIGDAVASRNIVHRVDFNNALLATMDEREYNAGRVIGIVERILIFYSVFNAQFAAIGPILAGKRFTRFKDLEKRPFAEYALIGTLLSTPLSIVLAQLTLHLLP